jgi:hypothetical protein
MGSLVRIRVKEGWGNTAGMWISTWGGVGNTADGVIKLRKGNIARKVISNWEDGEGGICRRGRRKTVEIDIKMRKGRNTAGEGILNLGWMEDYCRDRDRDGKEGKY